MADTFGGGDHERRRLFIMERTKTLIVHSGFFQRNKLGNYFNNIRFVDNFVNGLSINHPNCKLTKNHLT